MSDFTIPYGSGSDSAFCQDYHKFDEEVLYLWVEGKTDRIFYERIKKPKVICKSAGEAIDSEQCFGMTSKNYVILEVKSSKHPPIFGIVDKDYSASVPGEGVFWTDTRDLETMLIFSDKQLYTRLGCSIELEDIIKALFMAYQWGYIRDKLKLYKYDNRNSRQKNAQTAIQGCEVCFNDQCQISVSAVRAHLKRTVNDCPSNQEIKKFTTADKNISGDRWNTTHQIIDYTTLSDVWKYINGHDFTYFLQAINQDIAKQYSGRKYGLEYTLINNYDVLSFKSTALYELLAQANLLNI